MISIWIDVLENRIQPQDCILATGDNMTSMGWLRRSNFRGKWRRWPRVDSQTKSCNKSDKLSFRVSIDTLYSGSKDLRIMQQTVSLGTQLILLTQKIMNNFSFLLYLHRCLRTSKYCQFQKRFPASLQQFCCFCFIAQKQSNILLSSAGKASSSSSESTLSTLTIIQNSNKISSCQPLHKLCNEPLSLHQIETIWWRE